MSDFDESAKCLELLLNNPTEPSAQLARQTDKTLLMFTALAGVHLKYLLNLETKDPTSPIAQAIQEAMEKDSETS